MGHPVEPVITRRLDNAQNKVIQHCNSLPGTERPRLLLVFLPQMNTQVAESIPATSSKSPVESCKISILYCVVLCCLTNWRLSSDCRYWTCSGVYIYQSTSCKSCILCCLICMGRVETIYWICQFIYLSHSHYCRLMAIARPIRNNKLGDDRCLRPKGNNYCSSLFLRFFFQSCLVFI